MSTTQPIQHQPEQQQQNNVNNENRVVCDFTTNDQWKISLNIENTINNIFNKRATIINQSLGQICKWYLQGKCAKGDTCIYRHSNSKNKKDTRANRAKTARLTAQVCKHWLRGLCKKEDECEFIHEFDLAKMPPCQFFETYGKCTNPECLFIHNMNEELIAICPWYELGFCHQGPNCKKRHIRKKPCPNYITGFCINGPNCKLGGHPKYFGENMIQAINMLKMKIIKQQNELKKKKTTT